MNQKKKLIEVAIPLEAINKAAGREKSIRHGHPSTLHLWWARRPLAAARAVIFSQMVDDPSSYPDIFKSEREQKKERGRLFKIVEDLVQWENTTNPEVLERANAAIWESWRRSCAENADNVNARELFNREVLPGFHDPFAGGGAIPLEAKRLGLESYASDLNPVPVLINKAMIEIPPRFSGVPPVYPGGKGKEIIATSWTGLLGLSKDLVNYGEWIKNEAEKKLGELYPQVEISAPMTSERPDLAPYIGKKLKVIAWIWARTVKSPNPAYREVDVPLVSSFMLSSKASKETYVEPLVSENSYDFKVVTGKPKNLTEVKSGTKLARGANFKCLMSGAPISSDYIKSEGKAGRMGARLMAIVAEGVRGRIYLSPIPSHEAIAKNAKASWKPDVTISGSTQYLGIKPYGMDRIDQLYTERQLQVLDGFSELVGDAIQKAEKDAILSGMSNDGIALADGGQGARAYAEAMGVYLAFAVDKLADRGSTICSWDNTRDSLRNTFGRQAIPMTWDYAEANPFSESSGSYTNAIDQCVKVIAQYLPDHPNGYVCQADAQTQSVTQNKVVSTDPPYYDNVPYADLSDYFYVWLRRSLKKVYPELFSTVAVPKIEELVAFAYRHEDGKPGAEAFFLDGMTQAMHRIAQQAHPSFPVTIYYAFKQAESDDELGTTNTGWDTFLAAIINAGFEITGTWPMRTELSNRMRGSESNALASSIVLVCRKRLSGAKPATRRDFMSALKSELPVALSYLQAGNIAPVDLAQASIGPGMAVFTRYTSVIDAEGNPISVRSALSLINQVLDEALAEQEGDFEAETRWALAWFEQFGFEEDEFGIAEQLSKSKNTAVSGLVEAGVIAAGKGKVRLLKPDELPEDWDPTTDSRLTVWEMVHHLVRALEAGGESAAANIVAKLGSKSDTARELCYRLYTLCERKKRANEAMAYNALVQSWPEIVRLARETPRSSMPGTDDLFDKD